MEPEADAEVRIILKQWAATQGHDRCWWHPEYITPIAASYGVSIDKLTITPLDRDLFRRGCARFREQQYGQSQKSTDSGKERVTAQQAFTDWVKRNEGKDLTYHDEILRELASILDVQEPIRPNVTRKELREGCYRFQLKQYPQR